MFRSAAYLLTGHRGYSGKAEALTSLAEADFRTSYANVIRPNRRPTECRRYLSACHSDPHVLKKGVNSPPARAKQATPYFKAGHQGSKQASTRRDVIQIDE